MDYGVAPMFGSKPVNSGSRSITAAELITYNSSLEKTANTPLLQFCAVSEGSLPVVRAIEDLEAVREFQQASTFGGFFDFDVLDELASVDDC